MARVSATDDLEFAPEDRPVVTARGGHLHGCTFRLSALTLTAHAVEQADGTARVHVELRPTVAELVRGNGDRITHADWRHLILTADQCPEVAQSTLRELVRAVHMLHPRLALSDAA